MSQAFYNHIKAFCIACFVVGGYVLAPKILQVVCGFSIRNIYVVVDDRDVTRKKLGKNILNQLYTIYHSNTLSINTNKVYKMINAPKLKQINIFKKYPDTIIVKAAKKIPIAVFQMKGEYFYVDDNGDTYYSTKTNKYKSIVITGQDANLYVKQIMNLVKHNQFMSQNIIAASFIDKRRWDIYIFERGIKIMLPEIDSCNILKILESVEKLFYAIDKDKLTAVSYVDCRCGDIVVGLG